MTRFPVIRTFTSGSRIMKIECSATALTQTLQHILPWCKIALSQRSYRWRHDQVRRKLAEVLEGCLQGSKRIPWVEDHKLVTEGGGGGGTSNKKHPGLFPLTRNGT